MNVKPMEVKELCPEDCNIIQSHSDLVKFKVHIESVLKYEGQGTMPLKSAMLKGSFYDSNMLLYGRSAHSRQTQNQFPSISLVDSDFSL